MPRPALTCACGTMEWKVDAGAPGSRMICYCADCQTFARHVGHPEFLEPDGGTEIFQTLPAALHIVRGRDRLAALRLSPKGLMRWHAGCCGTPIANTLPSPGLPFAGVILPPGAPGFGPLVAEVNTAAAWRKRRQHGLVPALVALLRRALVAKLRGRTATPFFDAEGSPVVAPRVLSIEERNAARPS